MTLLFPAKLVNQNLVKPRVTLFLHHVQVGMGTNRQTSYTEFFYVLKIVILLIIINFYADIYKSRVYQTFNTLHDN